VDNGFDLHLELALLVVDFVLMAQDMHYRKWHEDPPDNGMPRNFLTDLVGRDCVGVLLGFKMGMMIGRYLGNSRC
jgi:hypothetical protein